jgi:hypothetical protein
MKKTFTIFTLLFLLGLFAAQSLPAQKQPLPAPLRFILW